MRRHRTARSVHLGLVMCAAAVLSGGGCSADARTPEVIAQDAAPPAVDPHSDDPDGVHPDPDALDADDAAPGSCTVVDDDRAARVPTEAQQRAKRAVFDVLDERFPADRTKKNPHRQLRQGFLGIAVDRPARTYVAVVDPALVDVHELDTELQAAADAEHARRPSVPRVKIRTQAGCHTAAEIVDALGRIPDLVRPQPGRISWHISAYDSRIHMVDMDPASPTAVRLREQLGELVRFVQY